MADQLADNGSIGSGERLCALGQPDRRRGRSWPLVREAIEVFPVLSEELVGTGVLMS